MKLEPTVSNVNQRSCEAEWRLTLKFRKNTKTEPEIQLIPFIGILWVLFILLMLSRTGPQRTGINLTRPVAPNQRQTDQPRQMILSVNAQGSYAVNKVVADAASTPPSVVNVMDAAWRSGLSPWTFATFSSEGAEF